MPPATCGLIHLIAAQAGALSKIRLIKFLYLADVAAFRTTNKTATKYEWKFYHYGPWTAEAQRDIELCAAAGVLESFPYAPETDTREVTLYRAGLSPTERVPLTTTAEVFLKSEIARWNRAPLNVFLNYVYFDTPPMRNASRGERLRFDSNIFETEPQDPPQSARRYTSRKAREAFSRLLAKRDDSSERVPIPRDVIRDEAFFAALEVLDAQDRMEPLSGTISIDPEQFRD